MKTKKKKYLPLYEKWMEQGRLDGHNGLCYEFDSDRDGYKYDFSNYELFELFYKDFSNYYIEPCGEFNGLRQTIVLFMAAMNDEL